MYFSDMGTVTMVAEGPHVRAVGWLDAAHAFPTGSVDPRVLDRIRAFANAWGESTTVLEWPVFCGFHECDLCETEEDASGSLGVVASGNFGVVDGETLFVCPEMIAHYIADHRYLPPQEFITAILRAELPGTDAYARSVDALRNRRSQ